MTTEQFSIWVEQHRRDMFRLAKRWTPEGAEDVVQEALMTFLRHRDLAAIDHPWTYLRNAIRSRAKVRRRSATRAKTTQGALKILSTAGHSSGRKQPAPMAE